MKKNKGGGRGIKMTVEFSACGNEVFLTLQANFIQESNRNTQDKQHMLLVNEKERSYTLLNNHFNNN